MLVAGKADEAGEADEADEGRGEAIEVDNGTEFEEFEFNAI